MKTIKSSSKEIELSVWQIFTLIIAAVACLLAIAPLLSRYRQNTCVVEVPETAIGSLLTNSDPPSDHHNRKARDVSTRDQCSIVPPLCLSTTTLPISTLSSATRTTRSTVSTVSVTRPVITSFKTSPRTTTGDPWANSTRPYNSWRLPSFAKPIDYKLYLVCPHCYTWIESLPVTIFYGKVSIRMNVLNETNYIVLHAKNLNITQAALVGGSAASATVTYLPEFEMIYLNFGSTTLTIGEHTLEIDYTGEVNEQDNTGFYREYFWKAIGELSYLLAGSFQPTHARKAFPCFDEPSMRASFMLTFEHPQNATVALSNSKTESLNATMTTFEATSIFSPSSFSWALLPVDEFKSVTQNISSTQITIWVRPELIGPSNEYLNWTFEVIEKTFAFVKTYLNLSDSDFPTKLDLIGVPDLTLDEKATTTWGLLTLREELVSTDISLNSAERLQSRTKAVVEHIIQLWFLTTDWWDNIWFSKSISSFLAYKMMEENYPSFKLMEQFPVREIVPFMMEDFKPSIWPVSNKNLQNNEQILDYLSVHIYSKGAAFLRQLEYIVGNEMFQAAVQSMVSITDPTDMMNRFYSNLAFPGTLSTTVTVEGFLRSWLEEKNYPIVTVDFIPSDGTNNGTTIVFRQTRYLDYYVLNTTIIDTSYLWNIYTECDLGGGREEFDWNITANYAPSKIKFMFDTANHTIHLDENYQWIKCNKDFYSYQVTEYISLEDDQYKLWQRFVDLVDENLLSSNDKANIVSDAFVLPHGGEIVTYDQSLNLIRQMYSDAPSFYLSWSVFIWHWNYLMGIEEHSKYFWNFKEFVTEHIFGYYEYNIDNVISTGTSHQEKILKSLFFELLCRVQNTDALKKATELYRRIPGSYFHNSTGDTNVDPEYLPTVLYYHIQNVNYIEEWDYLFYNFTENPSITSAQRSAIIRALSSAKDIWRLKSLLEFAFDFNSDLVEGQEVFDLIIAMSQNPIGRDVIWNVYRHQYQALLARFGRTNRLFNQLITNIAQSFENYYYYLEMVDFINQNPSPSQSQQLAIDQVLINYSWLNDGMAAHLDEAMLTPSKRTEKKT